MCLLSAVGSAFVQQRCANDTPSPRALAVFCLQHNHFALPNTPLSSFVLQHATPALCGSLLFWDSSLFPLVLLSPLLAFRIIHAAASTLLRASVCYLLLDSVLSSHDLIMICAWATTYFEPCAAHCRSFCFVCLGILSCLPTVSLTLTHTCSLHTPLCFPCGFFPSIQCFCKKSSYHCDGP